jgi:hypothetical protein
MTTITGSMIEIQEQLCPLGRTKKLALLFKHLIYWIVFSTGHLKTPIVPGTFLQSLILYIDHAVADKF